MRAVIECLFCKVKSEKIVKSKSKLPKFCTSACANKYNAIARKGKTYEELYGTQLAAQLKDKRRSYVLTNRQFPKHHSLATLEKIRQTSIGRPSSKKGLTFESFYGDAVASEIKDKMSRSKLGKAHTVEHNLKLAQHLRKVTSSPEYRAATSARVKLQWKNPELRDRMIRASLQAVNKRPNTKESAVQELLDRLTPNKFVYVGRGECLVGGKCPDFINLDNKKIIEFFGDFWHKPEEEKERIDYFKGFGYRTLVIWEHDLTSPKTISRILEFNKEIVDGTQKSTGCSGPCPKG